AANPGRPTVSTPATLTPVGYLQFESGYIHATDSPEFSSQSNLNEVVKFSVSPRLGLLVADGPLAHSRVQGQPGNGTGGVSLGAQGVVYNGEGARPTFALSYFHEVYNGNTPDLDIGSAKTRRYSYSAQTSGAFTSTPIFYSMKFYSMAHLPQSAAPSSDKRFRYRTHSRESLACQEKYGVSRNLFGRATPSAICGR